MRLFPSAHSPVVTARQIPRLWDPRQNCWVWYPRKLEPEQIKWIQSLVDVHPCQENQGRKGILVRVIPNKMPKTLFPVYCMSQVCLGGSKVETHKGYPDGNALKVSQPPPSVSMDHLVRMNKLNAWGDDLSLAKSTHVSVLVNPLWSL